MWAAAQPTWADFHYSNGVFSTNLRNLLKYQSANSIAYHFRLIRMTLYLVSVDIVGAIIFRRMKGGIIS